MLSFSRWWTSLSLLIATTLNSCSISISSSIPIIILLLLPKNCNCFSTINYLLPTTTTGNRIRRGAVTTSTQDGSGIIALQSQRRSHDADNNNNNNDDDDNNYENFDSTRKEFIHRRIINDILTNSQSGIGSVVVDDDNDNTRSSAISVIEMTFVGKGSIALDITPPSSSSSSSSSQMNTTRTIIPTQCLFLAPISSSSSSSSTTSVNDPLSCIPVPLPTTSSKTSLKLLSFAYQSKPISKSLCLALSPILINRDGSLYDNLPWDTWTIERSTTTPTSITSSYNNNNNNNKKRNLDAAGNNVQKKYHLGKRDAYNRFMGKDWYGRSISIGNLAARAKYLLENDDDYEDKMKADNSDNNHGDKHKEDDDNEIISLDENAAKILAKRVFELEIKECKMAIAEAQEQLAIIQTELSNNSNGGTDIHLLADETLVENYDRLQNAIQAVQDAKQSLDENEYALHKLITTTTTTTTTTATAVQKNTTTDETNNETKLYSILDKIINSQQTDAPPYRGAIGYKPSIDTKEEMFRKSILPYSSPYELMSEIINEQLHAEIIGCFIENTSLFHGSIVLGGALVLKRKNVKKEVLIDGERVVMYDSDDDLGNKGIKGGKVIVVECDCDEAIGMAMACGLSISISSDIWSSSKVDCVISKQSIVAIGGGVGGVNNNKKMTGVRDGIIPQVNIKKNEESIVLRTQGDGIMSKGTSIQVPRDYNDRSVGGLLPTEQDDRPVFNTDIPVKTLQEYDEMSIADKAQMLLSLESFQGRLPRPRVLKEATKNGKTSNDSLYSSKLTPLDEMLIPLIDESVRRQIMIREAERRGDVNEVEILNLDKSMRQIAKENAEEARNIGNEKLAELWEEEAEFYAGLRADVTQDEGMYSSFLDRDEWYERDRRKVVERNKKRFGSLFDNNEE